MLKEIFNNLLDSFTGGNEGYSSKKLTAFVITLLVIIVHVKWITLGDFSQLQAVLTIDFAFIATLFGIGTYQSIKNQPKTTTATLEKQITDDGSKTTMTNQESNSPDNSIKS